VRRAVLCGAAFAALVLPGPSEVNAGDPQAAQREYRVARRLAADRSPQAAAALQRVLDLDPAGPLADDALVEQARLLGIATWPEGLGALEPDAARDAAALLGRVVGKFASADRFSEARYYLALMEVEPLAGRDESAARAELIAVATTDAGSAWGDAARYALAWLDEQRGAASRAARGYQRLLVDSPGGEAAARAELALGRSLLRVDRPGEAAARLQRAADNALTARHATPLREFAVRSRIAGRRPPVDSESRVLATSVRQAAGIAATADGGLILGDRRGGQVLQLSPEGTEVGRWTVERLAAATLDPHGRAYAASDSGIYRLNAGQAPKAVAGLGDFTPVSALAVDGLGRFWLLDKRGETVARLEAGSDGPVESWQEGDFKLSDLIWNAGSLVAIDSRSKSLIAFTPEFTRESQPGPAFLKPIAVAADPSGRLAVLDSKAGSIVFLDRNGSPAGAFDCEQAGIDRPTDIDFADDGSFHIFDAARSAWVKLR